MIPKTIVCEDLYRNKMEVGTENLSFRPSVYGVLIEDGKVLFYPRRLFPRGVAAYENGLVAFFHLFVPGCSVRGLFA